MTATAHSHRPLTRWATAPIRALRYLNQELLASGEAMTRSNRFPQPRPQADLMEAKSVHPASAGKVLTRV